jgi:hypothetical protein
MTGTYWLNISGSYNFYMQPKLIHYVPGDLSTLTPAGSILPVDVSPVSKRTAQNLTCKRKKKILNNCVTLVLIQCLFGKYKYHKICYHSCVPLFYKLEDNAQGGAFQIVPGA